jgi:hypothetical protein
MMMDPTTMDALAKELWEIRRTEILQTKKARREVSSFAAAAASINGGVGGDDGNGNGPSATI